MESLYMMREIHAGRDTWNERKSLDIFDWIAGSGFADKYERFRACLREVLVRQDGISLTEAQGVVKQAFWSYLAQGLTRKWQNHYAQNDSGLYSELRVLARRIPGLRSARNKIRSFLTGKDNEISLSLEALLCPSCQYHGDFMPIYRAITIPRPGIDGRIADSPNGNQ